MYAPLEVVFTCGWFLISSLIKTNIRMPLMVRNQPVEFANLRTFPTFYPKGDSRISSHGGCQKVGPKVAKFLDR